ncbi:hypothetical protein BN1723_019969, partial [Verticillium longisporum]
SPLQPLQLGYQGGHGSGRRFQGRSVPSRHRHQEGLDEAARWQGPQHAFPLRQDLDPQGQGGCRSHQGSQHDQRQCSARP